MKFLLEARKKKLVIIQALGKICCYETQAQNWQECKEKFLFKEVLNKFLRQLCATGYIYIYIPEHREN